MNNYELFTTRLKLRSVNHDDLELIHALHLLEETDQFNTLGIPESIEETNLLLQSWIDENALPENRKFIFAVELKGNPGLIGLIGLNLGKAKYRNAEVWFKFHFNFWNKGYGTETLKCILNFGFNTLELHRIEAGCAIANIGSVKVLEKVGMIREAHTRKLLPLKSGWSDNYGYAILSTDQFQ